MKEEKEKGHGRRGGRGGEATICGRVKSCVGGGRGEEVETVGGSSRQAKKRRRRAGSDVANVGNFNKRSQ